MIFLDIKNNFLNIRDNDNKIIKFKTPYMKCPFGLENEYNKFLIKLEFTNLKTDIEIEDFYNKIIFYFNELSEYDSTKNLIKNIRYSNKFDPLIKFFLPFRYDKFEVNFYKNNRLVTSKELNKNSLISLDLEIPTIWFYKKTFGLTIKVLNIYIK